MARAGGSRAGEIRFDFGGMDNCLFRLGVGELTRIQEELDAGPTAIAAWCMVSLAMLDAMRSKDYVLVAQLSRGKLAEKAHLRVVFKYGLKGARELAVSEIDRVIRDYIDDAPLAEILMDGYRLCMAPVIGPADEPLGEVDGEAADQTSNPSPMEN